MSKRTLALGLGLLVMLVSMETLLTAGNLRPIFSVVELVAFLAAWVLIQWWRLSRPVYSWERTALADWAESQDCILLRCAHSTWHDREARERHAAKGYLYFVRVRDPEGDVRSAWVRLEFRGARLEVVRFRWEEAG